jgi:hypothetical protein
MMIESGRDPDVFMNLYALKCTKFPMSITNVTKERRKKLLLDETLVLLVCLVPVAVFFLWLQLLGELLKNCLEQLLLTRLVLCIPVPHRNLDRIPAD